MYTYKHSNYASTFLIVHRLGPERRLSNGLKTLQLLAELHCLARWPPNAKCVIIVRDAFYCDVGLREACQMHKGSELQKAAVGQLQKPRADL
jgi:hypothetical protein